MIGIMGKVLLNGKRVLSSTAPNKACTRRLGFCAFSGSLRGLEFVPLKQRYLVPPSRR